MTKERQEEEALRDMEAEARNFVTYVDEQMGHSKQRGAPHHAFAPRTISHVEALKKIIARLDANRAPPPPGKI